ncbi:MAG: hypothetical protein PVG78_18800 [Desulfobacterales bacterium]
MTATAAAAVPKKSVRFLLEPAPRSEREFGCTLTLHHGKRAQ